MPEFFQLLHFSHPYFIWGAIIPVVVIIISYISNFYTSNQYCDKELLAWVVTKNTHSIVDKLFLNKVTAILAWVLFCISLSGPRINIDERSLEAAKKYNNAAVIVLDVSRSMLAEDVYPNRITKAKLAIEAILSNSSNFLFSLVIYAHNAHVVIPLTYDSNVIRDVLDSIRPNMLPVEGSNYISGLNISADQLKLSGVENKSIILFSDGDFDKNDTKVNELKVNSIPVNVFGVGTREGQPIPNKNGGWLTLNNKPIFSSLNEVKLKEISSKHNGIYNSLGTDIKQNDFNLLKYSGHTLSTSSSEKTIVIWKQVYNWFLVPAIILFLLSTLRYRGNARKTEQVQPQQIIPVVFLLGLSFMVFTPSSANATENPIETANYAYHNNNFIKSETLYKKLNGFDALIGQANSVYKQKNYSKAIHLYTQAILSANNKDNRSTALFNLANTYYLIGDYSQSILLYRDALKYNPSHKHSLINIEYAIAIDKKVKRELALRNGNKTTIRPGSGPSTARIEQGIDIGNSKVTLADEDTNESPLYTLPLNDLFINKLVERGINHSNISSTKIDAPLTNSQWNFEHTTLDMVELLVKQEKIDNYNLWKRLFEIEEGFPAPVETPHVKPGVKAW